MICLTEDECSKDLRLSDTMIHLDLSFCSEIDNQAIHLVCNRMPKLKELILTGCKEVTDEGIGIVASLTPYIKVLHLGHCHRITDQVKKFISKLFMIFL